MDFSKAQQLLDGMGKGGVFLTAGKKPNPMIVGWGSIGIYWGVPVFIAPVRVSRYTRELIDETQQFCVTVPGEGMGRAIKICGTKSGRDTDKFAEAGLRPVKCRKISTSAVEGGKLTLECEVIAEMEMDNETAIPEVDERWYGGDGDYHIMYYGKIVEMY